jgi:hypothetical protein
MQGTEGPYPTFTIVPETDWEKQMLDWLLVAAEQHGMTLHVERRNVDGPGLYITHLYKPEEAA